jgi:hypothetical protein
MEPKNASNDMQQSLTRLHAQLSASSSVDESSKRLLREVMDDIDRLLRSTERAPQSAPAPAAHPARSRLEALAIAFDAEHPRLSASVRELVDLLGRAGL